MIIKDNCLGRWFYRYVFLFYSLWEELILQIITLIWGNCYFVSFLLLLGKWQLRRNDKKLGMNESEDDARGDLVATGVRIEAWTFFLEISFSSKFFFFFTFLWSDINKGVRHTPLLGSCASTKTKMQNKNVKTAWIRLYYKISRHIEIVSSINT